MSPAPDDLRLRLIAALALVVAISQLTRPGPALVALALAVAAGLVARLGPGLWKRLLHAELFLVLLLITLPFAVPGTPIFTLGPLNASAEGLARALLVAIKVSASVLVLVTFLGNLDPVRLGAALRALRLPEPLVRVFVLTARYLDVIRAEARRLQDAMRARGFAPRSNRHTWKSYGNLMGMLLVRALDRARRIEEAMRLRGEAGRFPSTALARPAPADWTRFGLALILAIALFSGDRAWPL